MDGRATALPAQPDVASARPNPRTYELLGRAEGLAGGTDAIGSQHGLLAYVWCGSGAAIFELERWGTTAPAAIAAAREQGVSCPPTPLPEPDRTPWGEPVFVPLDRYGDVVRALQEQLDAQTWGCNNHDGRAWVLARADIDIQPIVDRVLADP